MLVNFKVGRIYRYSRPYAVVLKGVKQVKLHYIIVVSVVLNYVLGASFKLLWEI